MAEAVQLSTAKRTKAWYCAWRLTQQSWACFGKVNDLSPAIDAGVGERVVVERECWRNRQCFRPHRDSVHVNACRVAS